MPNKKIKLIFLDEAIKILNRKKIMKKILIFLIILLSLTSCEEFTIFVSRKPMHFSGGMN